MLRTFKLFVFVFQIQSNCFYTYISYFSSICICNLACTLYLTPQVCKLVNHNTSNLECNYVLQGGYPAYIRGSRGLMILIQVPNWPKELFIWHCQVLSWARWQYIHILPLTAIYTYIATNSIKSLLIGSRCIVIIVEPIWPIWAYQKLC